MNYKKNRCMNTNIIKKGDFVFITDNDIFIERLDTYLEQLDAQPSDIFSLPNQFKVIKKNSDETFYIKSVTKITIAHNKQIHVEYDDILNANIMSFDMLKHLINLKPEFENCTIIKEPFISKNNRRLKIKITYKKYKKVDFYLCADDINGIVQILCDTANIENEIFELFKHDLDLVSKIEMLLKRYD